MALINLIPKTLKRETAVSPFLSLQDEMNRLFSDFFSGPELTGWQDTQAITNFMPKIDMSETDTAITIKTEMPGLSEKDVQIEIADNSLILKGEKKEEHEERDKKYFRKELSYGSFYRSVPIPTAMIDTNLVDAIFKDGMLTITLTKLESAKSKTKKIEIKKA